MTSDLSDVSGAGESSDNKLPTLKRSPAYQWRIAVSAISILFTVGLITVFVPMEDVENHGLHDLLLHVGWLLLFAGIGVRLWAASCLGGRKSRDLIQVGPYSLCRNPLYVGTLLIALSQPFFYESLWVLLGLMIPVLIYAFGVVPAEERKLAARFGESYGEYCRRTPRWCPRFRSYVPEQSPKGTQSASFALEGVRAAVWLLLPVLAAGITSLRSALH